MTNHEAMLIGTKIPGMMWPRELGWLFNNLQDSKLHAEIGSYCGRSLFMTAAGMKPGAKIISVDPSFPHGAPSSWLSGVLDLTIEMCPKEIEIERWKMLSSEASLKASQAGMQFDSVFIDGDHREDWASADIEAWLPLIKPGGIILGHDYWTGHQGVILAVNAVFGEEFSVVPNTRIWWKRV